ncbi:phosphotransferase family protein [Streptomyces sp. NPDC056660]|uniref:phosphotransferase family protein n=1 Tax=Streptomyces sp. NPDC056660 TaxID=3345897 RepID=UPI0036C027BF
MAVTTRRDLELTRRTLAGWLTVRLGGGAVDVRELVLPKAGYSNETAFFDAVWRGPDGVEREHAFVLRIEPTGHQLFVEPDAFFQARMMRALARHSTVPVPRVWFTEKDASLLGAPFYVMDRVAGRIPSDVPSWHQRGWTVELSRQDRGRLYDQGLTQLAALHRIDWREGFTFLAPAGSPSGSALEAYLVRLGQWYDWCAESCRHDTEVIDAAWEHVRRHRPKDASTSVVWGDARVGNMIFAEDLSVAALLDWETATVGPPGIDLGWWLMFEEFLCEGQGLTRLDGVPDRDATVARYEELSGRRVPHVGYYEILAGLVLALINSRLADLLVASGKVGEDVATEYVTRVTGMLGRRLG